MIALGVAAVVSHIALGVASAYVVGRFGKPLVRRFVTDIEVLHDEQYEVVRYEFNGVFLVIACVVGGILAALVTAAFIAHRWGLVHGGHFDGKPK